MCGRTACTLAPDVICSACSYYDPNIQQFQKPDWRDHPPPNKQSSSNDAGSGPTYKYYPSANIAPTMFTPVMIKGSGKEGESNRVLQPMMWGLIPPWHKGEAKSHGLSTNNARLEGLPESKLYKRPLLKRNHCVIVAQGFYEWKTVGAKPKTPKQPYFIYAPQEEDDVKVYDEAIWTSSGWDEEKGWQGPKILMMAGLYDVWKSPEGDEIYSYTVITMESNSTLSWLHDRMPAILDSPEQVEAWISPSAQASTEELLSILKPAEKLQYYPVSIKVNHSRCRDMDCLNPVKENKTKSFLANWLTQKKTQKKEDVVDDDGESNLEGVEEPAEKKIKLDETEQN